MSEAEKTTRELEWFDLETRMRELIHTQLEPTLAKAREDRESNQGLKSQIKTLEFRVKSLETAVLGDQKSETIIENIYKRCAEIEGNRKQDVVRIDQSLLLINESVNSFEIEMQKFKEEIKMLDKRDLSREIEISKINKNIESHKEHVLVEINSLNENFKEMNRVYQDVAMKTEEQANIATAKATANSLEMGNYKREIDTVRKDVVDSLSIIKEIRGLKLNIEVFEAEKVKIQGRFMQLSEEIAKFRDELVDRDIYVDKYIPLQTAIMISNYLYNVIDSVSRKKIADFETTYLRDLNTDVLNSREAETRQARADKILNDMKMVEERKVEFQTKEILSPVRGPNIKDIREKINIKKTHSFLNPDDSEVPEVIQSGLTKPEVEKIVQNALNIAIDAEIGRLKTELKEKLSNFKKFLKSFTSETSSMHTQFMNEIEDMTGRIKLNKSDMEIEIADIRKDFNDVKVIFENQSGTINNIQQLVVCIFEYCQIEQALQKQDEDDRHNMAVNMEKEMQSELASYSPKMNDATAALPSANFSFQKKCLSCSTTSALFSGFRTSIIYQPSPLFYRTKKFERQELLVMKGHMLKKCWDSVAPALSLKLEDLSYDKIVDKSLDKAIDKSFDKGPRFSRLGSIDEATQQSRDALPFLVSPSVRTRSTHKSKFSFRNVYS